MSNNSQNGLLLAKAIAIVSTAFEKKLDKGGHPYILHCLNVMNQMPNTDYELMSIAVLHDLVEDTHWTLQMLRDEGFSERIVNAVACLTHDPNVSYDDYIKIISTNKDARLVKLADLRHNSDITRLKGLKKSDHERLEKYCRSYVYLSE